MSQQAISPLSCNTCYNHSLTFSIWWGQETQSLWPPETGLVLLQETCLVYLVQIMMRIHIYRADYSYQCNFMGIISLGTRTCNCFFCTLVDIYSNMFLFNSFSVAQFIYKNCTCLSIQFVHFDMYMYTYMYIHTIFIYLFSFIIIILRFIHVVAYQYSIL